MNEFLFLLKLLKNTSVNTLIPGKLKNKAKKSTMDSKINAIKFYFEQVLHQSKVFFSIPCPKKLKYKVVEILNITTKLKHLLILKLYCGMGLRVSEIVNIKIEDIDSKNTRVIIRSAKGKKVIKKCANGI